MQPKRQRSEDLLQVLLREKENLSTQNSRPAEIIYIHTYIHTYKFLNEKNLLSKQRLRKSVDNRPTPQEILKYFLQQKNLDLSNI